MSRLFASLLRAVGLGDEGHAIPEPVREGDWLAGPSPDALLEVVAPAASVRRARLFLAGCCRELAAGRRVPPWFRDGIATAERLADGQVSEVERVAAVA